MPFLQSLYWSHGKGQERAQRIKSRCVPHTEGQPLLAVVGAGFEGSFSNIMHCSYRYTFQKAALKENFC